MTHPTDPRAILDALIAHVEHEGARAASDRVYCDLLALRDAMLAAEVEEQRAELAAAHEERELLRGDAEILRIALEKQGRQEVAPSDLWFPLLVDGRLWWHRGDPVAPDVSVFRLSDGWRWTEPGHESRPYPTARAAMLAAAHRVA